ACACPDGSGCTPGASAEYGKTATAIAVSQTIAELLGCIFFLSEGAGAKPPGHPAAGNSCAFQDIRFQVRGQQQGEHAVSSMQNPAESRPLQAQPIQTRTACQSVRSGVGRVVPHVGALTSKFRHAWVSRKSSRIPLLRKRGASVKIL